MNAKDIIKDEEAFDKICKTTFNQFDTDKNGFICKKELSTVYKRLIKNLCSAPSYEKASENLIKEYDKDKDGTLSFEEFKVLMKKALTQGL